MATRDELAKADIVSKELGREVKVALAQCGAAIDFGLMGATPVEWLATGLNTRMRLVEGAGTTWSWRPTLELSGNPSTLLYDLEIPRERIVFHEDCMCLSYLLRAHLDLRLLEILPARDERNAFVRDFVDILLFGNPKDFLDRLAEFGSLAAVHQGGIPITMVLGYLAKVWSREDCVEVFNTFTPYHGWDDGSIAPRINGPRRRLGAGRGGFEHVMLLRSTGRISRYGNMREHHVDTDAYEGERVVVSVTRQMDDLLLAGEIALMTSRTVVYSGNPGRFAQLFVEGNALVH